MKFILPIAAFIILGCVNDTSIETISLEEKSLLAKFRNLEEQSRLTIVPAQEPGEKLLLCLTFVDKESKRILKGQEVQFYHTSSTGEYEPSDPNDESTARLNGLASTDAFGRIFIKTILPGSYGSGENNRHIHTTVKNARPEAYDIHFKQFTEFMGKNFINGSDQHFMADLKYGPDSTLVTFLTIEAKNAKVLD